MLHGGPCTRRTLPELPLGMSLAFSCVTLSCLLLADTQSLYSIFAVRPGRILLLSVHLRPLWAVQYHGVTVDMSRQCVTHLNITAGCGGSKRRCQQAATSIFPKHHCAKTIFRRGLTPSKLLTRSFQGKGHCGGLQSCLSMGQEDISQLLYQDRTLRKNNSSSCRVSQTRPAGSF